MKPPSAFVIASSALAFAVTGCGGDGTDGPGTGMNGVTADGGANGGNADAGNGGTNGTSNGAPEPMPTFSYIYPEIIQAKCNGPLCHTTVVGGNLVMATQSEAYDNLIDQPAQGGECGPGDGGVSDGGAMADYVRVVPGNPDDSLMFLKLTAPPCGDPMPVASSLSPEEIELIRTWIEDGAQNN